MWPRLSQSDMNFKLLACPLEDRRTESIKHEGHIFEYQGILQFHSLKGMESMHYYLQINLETFRINFPWSGAEMFSQLPTVEISRALFLQCPLQR